MTISIADMASQAPSAQADLIEVRDFLEMTVWNIRGLIASSDSHVYDVWLARAIEALRLTK